MVRINIYAPGKDNFYRIRIKIYYLTDSFCEIPGQVVCIFNTYAQPDQGVGKAVLYSFFTGNGGMRHAGRMAYQ